MASVEQDVTAKFARLFTQSDWSLFKQMAEFHLKRAAHLRIADMRHVAKRRRLLARNSDKRLFIGIGTELLLKSCYLKHGFAINRPPRAGPALSFPFTFEQARGVTLSPDATYMLNDLVQSLSKVPVIGKLGQLERGLRIAKVFRNKEGHGVLPKHTFDPQDYRDVESALAGLYSRGFGQTLRVQFSLEPNEKAVWVVE
jgi:hypothetical protein